jgi:hypothetical protein
METQNVPQVKEGFSTKINEGSEEEDKVEGTKEKSIKRHSIVSFDSANKKISHYSMRGQLVKVESLVGADPKDKKSSKNSDVCCISNDGENILVENNLAYKILTIGCNWDGDLDSGFIHEAAGQDGADGKVVLVEGPYHTMHIKSHENFTLSSLKHGETPFKDIYAALLSPGTARSI